MRRKIGHELEIDRQRGSTIGAWIEVNNLEEGHTSLFGFNFFLDSPPWRANPICDIRCNKLNLVYYVMLIYMLFHFNVSI